MGQHAQVRPGRTTTRKLRFLLRLEAVNFDKTAMDIADLSAIRGGGEAMLVAPELIVERLASALKGTDPNVSIERIFTAASMILVRIDGSEALSKGHIHDALESILNHFDRATAHAMLHPATPGMAAASGLFPLVWPLLTFAVGLVVVDTNENDAMKKVEAAARRSQFERLTVDVPPFADPDFGIRATEWPCQADHVRPRGDHWYLPRSSETGEEYELSWSVALRRCLGRSGRRIEYYRRIIGEDFSLENSNGFVDHFGEIVEQDGSAWQAIVPEQQRAKMAILWLDANRLGAWRDEMVTDGATMAQFGDGMKTLRARFLRELVTFADSIECMRLDRPERKKTDGTLRRTPVLRFETLIWGADECLFVFPAWAVKLMIEKIAALLQPDQWRLTVNGRTAEIAHAAGLVLCSHKAPIQTVAWLAQELADAAKEHDRTRSMMQYWIMGHIDLPTRPLSAEREAMYAIGPRSQPGAFTLPLATIGGAMRTIARVRGRGSERDEGIPRSKLADIVLGSTGSIPGTAGVDVDRTIEDLLQHGPYESFTPDDLLGSALGGGDASARHAPLIHILEFWPFVGIELDENAPSPKLPLEAIS